MQEIEKLLKDKKISYRDFVIYIYLKEYQPKTIKQICLLLGCDYSRCNISLNLLIEYGLIIKTPDYPVRYILK